MIFINFESKSKNMFRKTDTVSQIDIFGGIPNILQGKSHNQYSDNNHWHNQFRAQIVSRIDESTFKVLFNETTGAPNSSIRILIGMMILKEGFGWSDSQLFENCRFNLLVRGALGLFNLNDDIPVESTYYLFRKRLYEYEKQTGEELITSTFKQITSEQVEEFQVNGQIIRMDSKLLGSNIAFYSRYEIILHALISLFKTLNRQEKSMLSSRDKQQLRAIAKEEPQKTVHRSTREEIKSILQEMGALVYKLVYTFSSNQSEQYQLLCRVFNEQYKVIDNKKIELRAREEIKSDSIQSPHDTDSAYRKKDGKEVKGYTVNLTETASDKNVNLITSVIVEKANVPDTEFIESALETTREVTNQVIKQAFADGAYQSPANDKYCDGIDMVFTSMQGFESRYDLEMTPDGLVVIDTQTGQHMQAVLAKKFKNSNEDRWRIRTESGNKYFGQQAIRASAIRRKLNQRSKQELNKRNNVEATIFHFCCLLRNNKTKYRNAIKNKMWANCRCLWINMIRIMKYTTESGKIFIETTKTNLRPVIIKGHTIKIRRILAKFNYKFIAAKISLNTI